MEISVLLTLDLDEQAALQAALATQSAPDMLMTLALTGACRISSLGEVRQLRNWLAETRLSGDGYFTVLELIEKTLADFDL